MTRRQAAWRCLKSNRCLFLIVPHRCFYGGLLALPDDSDRILCPS